MAAIALSEEKVYLGALGGHGNLVSPSSKHRYLHYVGKCMIPSTEQIPVEGIDRCKTLIVSCIDLMI